MTLYCANNAPFTSMRSHSIGSVCINYHQGREGYMLTLRLWVLVVVAAGMFAGLPLSNVWACDDDRFPCPIVSETPTYETHTPAQPAPRKKASQPAREDVREQSKVERSAPRAAGGTKASKRTVQEQAADPPPQQAVEAAPATGAMALTDRSTNDGSQTEDRVANAAAAWPVRPDTEGADASTSGADLAEPARERNFRGGAAVRLE